MVRQPKAAGRCQKRRFQRKIDDVGHPKIGAQGARGQRACRDTSPCRSGCSSPRRQRQPSAVRDVLRPPRRALRPSSRFSMAQRAAARAASVSATDSTATPSDSSAWATAAPAPPAPSCTTGPAPHRPCCAGMPRQSRTSRCCDQSARPSRNVTVLTAPKRRASSERSSRKGMIACLTGWVTLTPAKPGRLAGGKDLAQISRHQAPRHQGQSTDSWCQGPEARLRAHAVQAKAMP